MRPMEKVASCQIAFTPIVSEEYLRDIDAVLNIIKNSSLEYNIGVLSTTIRGPKDKILKLILTIYNEMDMKCRFTMDIKISNICGCEE